ncbi:MAG: hypothetical protein EZS28_042782 [Streblomastix strix]|uniref:Uncharacterized protein n=1 Tax=Streblomastix strix TaxID=222440 RepID=A0A5J4TVU5_9EUKA|nr:MAG: hypothetical protein EZS28_042782 [Streblomastix strix]
MVSLIKSKYIYKQSQLLSSFSNPLISNAEKNYSQALCQGERKPNVWILTKILKYHNKEYYEQTIKPLLKKNYEAKKLEKQIHINQILIPNKIDLSDDFTLLNMQEKAANGEYENEEQIVMDLARLLVYYEGETEDIQAIKGYDAKCDTQVLHHKLEGTVYKQLKKINKNYKKKKIDEKTSETKESTPAKQLTAKHIFKKYASKFAKKGCKLISDDPKILSKFQGYKATDACLNRVYQFYSQRPFVVPTQRLKVWPFPTNATRTEIQTSQNVPLSHVSNFSHQFRKDARATTCFENPCYQNMQETTCGRNFPDMPMNTLDQQFFLLQLNASNLDLLFEATDEFEDALTTPRNIATRRLNTHTDLTSFLITLQCERNSNGALTFDGLDTQNQNTSVEFRGALIYQGATDSYYNVDTTGKRPPPPILCTVNDTFWLFSPAAGGSCIYDTNHSFGDVIGPLSS